MKGDVQVKDKVSFEEVQETVMNHVRERGWDKEYTSRGLAISISLEANELLEYFQWGEDTFGSREDLASELADVFIYAIEFADKNDIDILPAILQKLKKSAQKYPAELFQSKTKEERERAWLEAKQKYQKDTTL